MMIDLTRVPVYLASGFLRPGYYPYTPFLFIVAISGSYFSRNIVSWLSPGLFRRIILIAVSIVSLKLIYDGSVYLGIL